MVKQMVEMKAFSSVVSLVVLKVFWWVARLALQKAGKTVASKVSHWADLKVGKLVVATVGLKAGSSVEQKAAAKDFQWADDLDYH